MNIQELERELFCLRCEVQGEKLRECDCEFADQECRARIAAAYYRLVQVWDRETTGRS